MIKIHALLLFNGAKILPRYSNNAQFIGHKITIYIRDKIVGTSYFQLYIAPISAGMVAVN